MNSEDRKEEISVPGLGKNPATHSSARSYHDLDQRLREAQAALLQMQIKFNEAQDVLDAIQTGKVDALVVDSALAGPQIISLTPNVEPHRAFVEAMNEGALIIDKKETITFCNKKFSQMVEVPAEKIMGDSLYNYVPPAERGTLEKLLIQQTHSGMKWESLLQDARGEPLPVSLSIAELSGEEIQGTCVVVEDLTQWRRFEALSNEQKWLGALLDLMPLALLVIHPGSGKIQFANKAADSLSGGEFPRKFTSEVFRKKQIRFTDDSDREIAGSEMPWVRVARGERLDAYAMSWHCPSGVRCFLVYGATLPALYNHAPVAILNFVEVTEARRAERDLKSRATELRRSNAELKQFAYVASHDLQEPLRMITLYLQLLMQKFRAQLGTEGQIYSKYVIEGAQRMSALIHDLLVFASLGKEASPPERVDTAATLETAKMHLSASIREAKAVITHESLLFWAPSCFGIFSLG